jgi:hypothetical protein
MKIAVFWDVTTCDSSKNRRLGGMFLPRCSIHPDDGIVVVQEPHGIASQKMAFFLNVIGSV